MGSRPCLQLLQWRRVAWLWCAMGMAWRPCNYLQLLHRRWAALASSPHLHQIGRRGRGNGHKNGASTSTTKTTNMCRRCGIGSMDNLTINKQNDNDEGERGGGESDRGNGNKMGPQRRTTTTTNMTPTMRRQPNLPLGSTPLPDAPHCLRRHPVYVPGSPACPRRCADAAYWSE